MSARRRETWLLVTAHPDDEAMFFLPTLRHLLGSTHRTVRVLCLSNGDYRAEADGPVRTRELSAACAVLGLDAGAATILNGKAVGIADGPDAWRPELVSRAVLEHLRDKMSSAFSGEGKPKEGAPSWRVLTKETAPSLTPKRCVHSINLLTFDEGGVSGHPNHVDSYRGIHHLLHETCHISRGNAQSKVEPTAKLWLYPDAAVAHKETRHDMIELEVSVYTLRTIANPFHKYFLWVFVDIMPFLFMWLYQALLYLAYYLTGGILRGKAGPEMLAFVGTSISQDGERTQCRSLEPRRAWLAMAAHRSQFVWYRRLSVLFSRYTYINDLLKLTIEMSTAGEEEEDESDDSAASLPPVVTATEPASAPPFLLTPAQMHALQAAIVPVTLQHRPWQRVYCLSRDGDAFIAFCQRLDAWYGQRLGCQATLLVVKTTTGDVVGGFADVPLVPRATTGARTAGSCLFAVRVPTGPGDPPVTAYGRKWCSAKTVVCDPTRRIVGFGGGKDKGFGLCLGDNFARGTTAKCAAFGSPPLVSAPDGVFGILDVEVWGFVFGQL